MRGNPPAREQKDRQLIFLTLFQKFSQLLDWLPRQHHVRPIHQLQPPAPSHLIMGTNQHYPHYDHVLCQHSSAVPFPFSATPFVSRNSNQSKSISQFVKNSTKGKPNLLNSIF